MDTRSRRQCCDLLFLFFSCKTFFVLPGVFFLKKRVGTQISQISMENKMGTTFYVPFYLGNSVRWDLSIKSFQIKKASHYFPLPSFSQNGFLNYLPWQVSPISPEEKRNFEFFKGKERENGSHYFFLPPAQELKGPESTALCLNAPFLLLLSRFKIARFMRKKKSWEIVCAAEQKKGEM